MNNSDYSCFAVTRILSLHFLCAFGLALALLLMSGAPAFALKTIEIKKENLKSDSRQDIDTRQDLTRLGDFYAGNGQTFQVETAPDRQGFTQRIVVNATTSNIKPNWMVFSLKNTSDQHLERWLVADRYTILGSRIFWPDLDAPRLLSVTPSLGFRPRKISSDLTDIFKISIEPGEIVTYVVELVPGRFPNLSLWQPSRFEEIRRSHALFNGILLGITGLIAIFLTVIFVANHNIVFPAAALVAWSVLAYLCVDFGFLDKLFNLDPERNALYRAVSEAAFAASLLTFFFIFLRLSQWHLWARVLFYVWILLQVGLVFYAFINPFIASGLARISIPLQAVVLTLFVVFLAVGKQKRALSLMPTWMHFLVWIFGGGVIIEGLLSGDLLTAGLNAGMVLFVALIGFLVIQFAFHQADQNDAAGLPGALKTRALALEGAGAYVWEWNDRRDEIRVAREVEESLGLTWGTLSCRVHEFLQYLHPSDRDRMRQTLFDIQEEHGGDINLDFRMRRTDGTYLWFDLDAHSVDGGNSRYVRCVGLIRDVTSEKRSRERLMHDAVHDSLTGLPNRRLFLDRLETSVQRAKNEGVNPPTIILIDIDRFKNVNSSLGLGIGDSLLLAVARRLQETLKDQDTLARVGGDQFAIKIIAERDPRVIAQIAENVRKVMRQPIEIAGHEVILTSSMGISIFDKSQSSFEELFREAEIAMYRAKRLGTDRIEIYVAEMRSERDERVALESDLRQAIARQQLTVLYQPIMEIGRNQLAGFEALLRWNHPKFGMVNPDAFVPIAEESGSIYELGMYVMNEACSQLAEWQKQTEGLNPPLTISVNVSSRQLFQHDLVQDMDQILRRFPDVKGHLRLEITESLVMENPEKAVRMLDRLKAMGLKLSMDDFGTGYSSLAYLSRFPFDTLKVDREIVQISDKDSTAPAILRSIIALGHELQMDIVAEGLETEKELGFLREIGCDYAQGFYFGQPMTGEEIDGLLTAMVRTSRLPLSRPKEKSRVGNILPLAKPSKTASKKANGEERQKKPEKDAQKNTAEVSAKQPTASS